MIQIPHWGIWVIYGLILCLIIGVIITRIIHKKKTVQQLQPTKSFIYNQSPIKDLQQVPQVIYVQTPRPQTSGWCIAGFVLSFVLFITPVICCIAGISDCNKYGYAGKGFGVAGLTITIIKVLFFIITLTDI